MAEPLKHNIKIAADIKAKIRAGVSMRVIHDYLMDKYPSEQCGLLAAPKSMQALYRVYRGDITDARADIQHQVGAVVVAKALEGDLKAAELFLRSKAGWNPTIKVEETDPDEVNEDTSAVDDLVNLLGLKKALNKED
jgi:hypothetical protein